MIGRRSAAVAIVAGAGALALGRLRPGSAQAASAGGEAFPVQHTAAEWHQLLSPAAFDVLREQGTEMPYSSPLNDEHRAGRFACAGCDHALFDSRTKFNSGTGWPSFYAPLPGAVATRSDSSYLMDRTEVHCATCGGHLGHVFADGPPPTGQRYCMNGVALRFAPVAA